MLGMARLDVHTYTVGASNADMNSAATYLSLSSSVLSLPRRADTYDPTAAAAAGMLGPTFTVLITAVSQKYLSYP